MATNESHIHGSWISCFELVDKFLTGYLVDSMGLTKSYSNKTHFKLNVDSLIYYFMCKINRKFFDTSVVNFVQSLTLIPLHVEVL